MKIVFLDVKTIGEDIDLSQYEIKYRLMIRQSVLQRI